MNGNNNFNNQSNNNGFNNSNNTQGNMLNLNQGGNNGFNNQMPQNNLNQQQNQFQNGPMPCPMNNQFNNNNNSGQKKNTLGIILGVVGVIALVGIGYSFFGGKTLTCTTSDKTYGMTYNDVVKVKFKNDKVKSINQETTVDLGDYSSQKDEIVKMFEEEYEDDDDLTYSVKTQGDKIVVSVTATTEDGFDYFFYGDYNYDDLKKDLEDDGYTCK